MALDKRGYNPMEFYQKSSNLRRCLDQIRAGLFSPKQPDLFSDFIDNLLKWDRFKVCADFDSYIECQKEVSKLYTVSFSKKLRIESVAVKICGTINFYRTLKMTIIYSESRRMDSSMYL